MKLVKDLLFLGLPALAIAAFFSYIFFVQHMHHLDVNYQREAEALCKDHKGLMVGDSEDYGMGKTEWVKLSVECWDGGKLTYWWKP